MQPPLDKLKSIIDRFNSLQDEWEANLSGGDCWNGMIDIWLNAPHPPGEKEDSVHTEYFLLHWNDHLVAKVLWGDKEVCSECGGKIIFFEPDMNIKVCRDRCLMMKFMHPEPAWVFRSKSAFSSELSGEGLVEYFYDNLRERRYAKEF